MIMVWIVAGVLGWIACSVGSYFCFRWTCKALSPWTTTDRRFTLVISACGPFALIAAAIVAISTPTKSEKPAKW